MAKDDSYILDLWEPLKPRILDHLNRYLVADEVEINDLTDGYAMLSIQGPSSEQLLGKFVEKDKQPQQPIAHSTAEICGVEVRICRYSHTGEDGFDLMIPVAEIENVARRLTETGSAYSAQWVGTEAYEIIRIEAGIPRYGIDITEDNLILETGLNHAVSFNKGCYLGQEVVERIRSRGHVNKNLTGLVIDGEKPATMGSKVLIAEKEIGTITSSVYSPALELRDRTCVYPSRPSLSRHTACHTGQLRGFECQGCATAIHTWRQNVFIVIDFGDVSLSNRARTCDSAALESHE